MAVDEQPMDPTDPMEEMSPVHSLEAESKEVPAAGRNVPPHSDGASSPIAVPQEDGCDLNEESQKDRASKPTKMELREGPPSWKKHWSRGHITVP